MKRLIAILTIFAMLSGLAACGTTEESGAGTNIPTEAATNAVEETTAEPEAETEEDTTGASDEEETKDAPAEGEDAELAEVQAVLDGYFKAAEEQDIENLIKYHDFNFIHYLSEGVYLTDEQLLEKVGSLEELGGEQPASYGTMTVSDVECHDEMISAFQDFLSSDFWNDEEGENGEKLHPADYFTIDGVYTCTVNSTGTAEFEVETQEGVTVSGSASTDFNVTTEYAILRINGEWKVDITMSMMMMFANMIESMKKFDEENGEASDDDSGFGDWEPNWDENRHDDWEGWDD